MGCELLSLNTGTPVSGLHLSAAPLCPSDHRRGEPEAWGWYLRETLVLWVLIPFNSCSPWLCCAMERTEVHGIFLTCLASSRPKAGQDGGRSLKTLSHHITPPAGTLGSQTTRVSQFCFSPLLCDVQHYSVTSLCLIRGISRPWIPSYSSTSLDTQHTLRLRGRVQ